MSTDDHDVVGKVVVPTTSPSNSDLVVHRAETSQVACSPATSTTTTEKTLTIKKLREDNAKKDSLIQALRNARTDLLEIQMVSTQDEDSLCIFLK